jgi:FkbM family methyltransferase
MDSARAKYGQPKGIFSQLDEDLFLTKYFDEIGLERGRFLDIGSYDGVLYSNTRAFAMRGWEGVCLEPSRPVFEELCNLYPLSRSKVRCHQAAVTVDNDGEIDLYETPDPVSTTEIFNRDKFSTLATFKATKVQAMSFKKLAVAYPGPYHLISIDTEGTSIDLALALPIEILAMGGIVVVELDLDVDKLFMGMKTKGFIEVHNNGLNALFVRASEVT